MSDIDRLAEAHGISLSYISEQGERREVSSDGVKALLRAMGVDATQPLQDPGHKVSEARASQIAGCFVPAFLKSDRVWGMSCQLYGMRSARNWGMGDFADLAEFARLVGARGGDFIGVNPLHTLFPNDPERCSPYGPSTKRFLNPLYIAPDMEPEYRLINPIPDARLQGLRDSPLVDYSGVAIAKWAALKAMFAAFRQATAERAERFEGFRVKGGDDLENLGLFEALSAHMQSVSGRIVPWSNWPAEFLSPQAAGIDSFRQEHTEDIRYFIWLQWLADEQLARAHDAARDAGMRVGLYADLAVGVVPDSAATWSDPDLVIKGAGIGSPADTLNPSGQDWGLAPLSPVVLAQRNIEPLRLELSASMRHAGAVRLDHSMSLQRLFWVPNGMSALEGAYVHYPFYDMIGAVAEASNRYSALVIAEALGTVPEGFTDALATADIHAYQVLFFQRRPDGGFMAPHEYSQPALACVATHDLATTRGWWIGRDIDWRETVGVYDAEEATNERIVRATSRQQLWAALKSEGLVPTDQALPDALDVEAVVQVHIYASRTPSRLFGIQIEDALGEIEQANLPGRTDPHPNWRRKLPEMLENFAQNSFFNGICGAASQSRPRR